MNDADLELLRRLVLTAAKVDMELGDLSLDQALFEDGLGLDSFAIVDLVMAVERAFGVQFRDEDFLVGNFASIRAIGALVDRCRARG